MHIYSFFALKQFWRTKNVLRRRGRRLGRGKRRRGLERLRKRGLVEQWERKKERKEKAKQNDKLGFPFPVFLFF
jgi:hypothetical protein